MLYVYIVYIVSLYYLMTTMKSRDHHNRYHQTIDFGMTVPNAAWKILREKEQNRMGR